MSFLRALVFLAAASLPSFSATFGTVVAHAQPIADLAIDEARHRLYIVNTASNQVEVYSTTTNPPRLTDERFLLRPFCRQRILFQPPPGL